MKLSPLEKIFTEYQIALDINADTYLHEKVQKVDKEAELRFIWFRVTEKLSPKKLDRVLTLKILNGQLVKHLLIKYNMLPEVSTIL